MRFRMQDVPEKITIFNMTENPDEPNEETAVLETITMYDIPENPHAPDEATEESNQRTHPEIMKYFYAFFHAQFELKMTNLLFLSWVKEENPTVAENVKQMVLDDLINFTPKEKSELMKKDNDTFFLSQLYVSGLLIAIKENNTEAIVALSNELATRYLDPDPRKYLPYKIDFFDIIDELNKQLAANQEGSHGETSATIETGLETLRNNLDKKVLLFFKDILKLTLDPAQLRQSASWLSRWREAIWPKTNKQEKDFLNFYQQVVHSKKTEEIKAKEIPRPEGTIKKSKPY